MSNFAESLKDFKELIGFGVMCVLAFIWMENKYVDAAELSQFISRDLENQIYYLEQKQIRLNQQGKQLDLEDKALLERLRRDLRGQQK